MKRFFKKLFLTQMYANPTQINADLFMESSATIRVQSAGICVQEKFFKAFTKLLCILFFFLYFCALSAHASEYYKVALDIETSISEGELNPADIAEIADEQGIDAVILSDEFCTRFEFGLGPLKRMIKKTAERNSACMYGFKKYIDLINGINKRNKGALLIEGFEVSPYYWWRGSFFKNDLQIMDWHRQFLVTGLDFKGYEGLPVVSTGKSRHSPYESDLWFAPYQEFIDYVDSKGGLCFWAHPDGQYNEKVKGFTIFTQAYPEILAKTYNYTGFGILFGGYEMAGRFGGIWDGLLMEYCYGKRKAPVWAVGELDYSNLKQIMEMDELLNFVQAKAKTRDAILSAIKKGKLYVSRNMHKEGIFLKEFYLRDELTGEKAYNAETLTAMGGLSLVVKLQVNKPLKSAMRINVLKNARFFDIKEISEVKEKEVDITFRDKVGPGQEGYFRVEIDYRGGKIISNPIFFK